MRASHPLNVPAARPPVLAAGRLVANRANWTVLRGSAIHPVLTRSAAGGDVSGQLEETREVSIYHNDGRDATEGALRA